MSYSVCMSCQAPVTGYQKYCHDCEKVYKQDEEYWKTAGYSELTDDKRLEHKRKDKR